MNTVCVKDLRYWFAEQQISLRRISVQSCSTTKYVSVSSSDDIRVNTYAPYLHESFFVHSNGDEISLQTYALFYLSVKKGKVLAASSSCGADEKFLLLKHDNGEVRGIMIIRINITY